MKHFMRTLLTSAAVAGLVASATQAEEPVRGGTLVSVMGSNPRTLNGAVQSGIVTGYPAAQLFASPLRYDEDWTPQPYLAESWEISEDGLSFTLNLVKDAVFHDGQPITSEDIAFSIDVIKANHPFKTMFAPVESVETPDAHTAILKLSRPHPALMLAISGQLMSILPKHIYGDVPVEEVKSHPRNNENVVGSGPFKLVEFKSGEHVILERFDDFFIEGRPYLDRVVLRIITDVSARTIAYENGELHMGAFESVPQMVNRLKGVDGITVTPEGYGAIGPLDWLAMNTQRGPLKDKRVRQAIAYAVDKKFIQNALMQGTAADSRTGIHPDSPFYYPDVPTYDLDLDKAKALLDEAGFPMNGDSRFSLTIDFGWPGVKPQVEYVKAALKKVGIDVEVRASADFPTWAKRMGEMDFDMSWDTVFNWGDPVIGVHRTYVSSNIGKGVWSNTQGYSNARVDELLAMAAVETDPAKRKELYKEFQLIIADELPVYHTNTLPYHTVYSDKVGNPPLGIWGTSTPIDMTYLKE
ncbi:ABC transporter substrate-binding protein [Pseudaestuariivita atlantica]|uniref:Peptide ABC transporter substrate-binding protein n=1 Tax=Pseudaestuariivita atlantica TaxID=1317121 RepID=A0A0L1JMX0_9RHOB|nr:ABC transporter substrate-binding protein [Pseudaestuariivita atlantica]KNG93105.1 peptide ABC transporter substrate-binding protein [Pseudaestuariivita atlantica]